MSKKRRHTRKTEFSVFVLVELFLICRGRIGDEVVAGEVMEEINKKKGNKLPRPGGNHPEIQKMKLLNY